jgi:hypothetical protein
MELVIAIISAVVAVISTCIAVLGQIKLARIQGEREEARDRRQHERQAAQLLSKYREPLARAAFELQSKLFNILNLGLLKNYYVSGDANEKEYALQNTLYVVAQYFAWNEIILREIEFLDVGEVEATRRLVELNEAIVLLFLTHRYGSVFRVFRGEQRAIGDKMISIENGNRVCLGYATFVENQSDDFRRWFRKLNQDLILLSEDLEQHAERLVRIQNAIIDLLDYLDPDCIRFGKPYRTKAELDNSLTKTTRIVRER